MVAKRLLNVSNHNHRGHTIYLFVAYMVTHVCRTLYAGYSEHNDLVGTDIVIDAVCPDYVSCIDDDEVYEQMVTTSEIVQRNSPKQSSSACV